MEESDVFEEFTLFAAAVGLAFLLGKICYFLRFRLQTPQDIR